MPDARDPPDDALDLLALLDELRIIAENGLAFADDPYDEERYGRLRELVDEYYGRTLSLPPATVRERLAEEMGPVTPKVGATGAVVDGDAVLVMRRPGGGWCLPGGHADPGEAPEETVVREVREETGLRVDPVALVDAYRVPAGEGYDPHGAITICYRCEPVGGELRLSREGETLRWAQVDEVTDWFADHERYARDALTGAGPGLS